MHENIVYTEHSSSGTSDRSDRSDTAIFSDWFCGLSSSMVHANIMQLRGYGRQCSVKLSTGWTILCLIVVSSEGKILIYDNFICFPWKMSQHFGFIILFYRKVFIILHPCQSLQQRVFTRKKVYCPSLILPQGGDILQGQCPCISDIYLVCCWLNLNFFNAYYPFWNIWPMFTNFYLFRR